MDTYLDRPIFPFDVDLAKVVEGAVVWGSNRVQVGCGAAIDTTGWEFSKRRLKVQAISSRILDIKRFFSEIHGAVCGFWMPYPSKLMNIVSCSDTSQILVKGGSVASFWETDPCKHVCLNYGDEEFHAKIIDATAVNGNTLLTVDPALSEIVSSEWDMSLLLYVRLLDDDKLEIVRSGDGYLVSFSCIEQPHEYENPKDSSTTPIYLYEIGYILGDKENMERYTSWGTLVQGTDGSTWDPRPIYHDDINRDAEGAETSLECVTWTDCPLKDLFPKADGLPLTTRIYETGWDWQTKKETGTRQLLIQSDTRTPEEEGRRLSASLMDGFQANDRSVPVDIKTRNCQVPFCSAKCGLNRSLFCVEATVKLQVNSSLYYVDIDPVSTLNTSRLEFGLLVSDDYHTGTPSKYWAWQPIQGYASLGDGSYRIQIRQPFNRLSIGDPIWVYYGCNHSVATCKAYNNFARFKASPNTPLKDPKINTETYTSTGKKG